MPSLSRLVIILAIIFIGVTLAGCTRASDELFTIRVSGPPGASFTGQCSAIESDQTTSGVPLHGILSAEHSTADFEAVGEQIYCALYPENLSGALELELLRDGEVLDSAQASAPFQDISVEYPAWGVLEGRVTIGPLMPVSRVGVPDPTPIPEVFTSREIVIYGDNGQTEVTRVQVSPSGDYHGAYRVPLPTGTYVVDINHIGIDIGADLPATVDVVAGQTTRLDIDIDTGIR